MVRLVASGHVHWGLQMLTTLFLYQENVRHRKCEADACAKQPVFGFPGERPRRCKAHRLGGMARTPAQGTDAWTCAC